jgi:hypothetical protein
MKRWSVDTSRPFLVIDLPVKFQDGLLAGLASARFFGFPVSNPGKAL